MLWAYILGGILLLVISALGILKLLTYIQRVKRFGSSQKDELLGKHVVITGGSSGIGLCVAHEVSRRGANVSIIARSKERLEAAAVDIRRSLAYPDKQKVVEISCDITTHDDTELQTILKGLIGIQGPVFMLVNCAGFSIPSKLETLTMTQIRQQMDVNFFGTANITRAILPKMKSAGHGGIIVFVSSLAGLVGLYGFTGYAASKFAVRGFAEALAMEVQPYGISVTVNCPPDTDTPGLHEEEKFKPEETKIISQSAGLFQPESVARTLVEDALDGKFLSSNGMDGFMLTTLCAGMGPGSLFEVISQSMLAGIFRIVAWGHVQYFNRVVRQSRARKDGKKKVN